MKNHQDILTDLPPFPTPEQALPPDHEQIYPEQKRAIRTRVAAGLLIAASVAGGSEYYTGSPTYAVEAAYDYALNNGAAASPETLAKVDSIVDRPANPELKALKANSKTLLTSDEAETMHRKYELFTMKKAAEHGLTVIDPKPYREKIEQANGVSDVTSVVNSYTKQLGFEFSVPEKRDLLDLSRDSGPIDPSTIDPDKFKKGAEVFVSALASTPKEVITQAAKVRELRLVDHMDKMENKVIGDFEPEGKANLTTGVISIPLKSFYEGKPTIYPHEIGHRLDKEENGGQAGQYRDARYRTLNPPNFIYGDANSPDLKTAVADPYGATNIPEDKGKLYERMLNGLSTDYLYRAPDPIRAKYRELLGRLEETVPGSVGYLMDVSGGTDLPDKYEQELN
jgi:hypothetical protein